MEIKKTTAVRRVADEKIPYSKIRLIWTACLRGDPGALKQKNYWHQKHPELDNRFAEFCLILERMRDPKKAKKKKKKVHTDVANTDSVWSRARDKHMSSTKGSAWPVSGGLPSLGKRR